MTQIGTELYKIKEAEKKLKKHKEELIKSCEHTGEFTFPLIEVDRYKIDKRVFDIKCTCSDCGREFYKQIDSKAEFYEFRREHVSKLGKWRKKDLDLLDFINDVFIDSERRTNSYNKSIFFKAVDIVTSGEQLQSIFSGDIKRNSDEDWHKESSALFNLSRQATSYWRESFFIDDLLYKKMLGTKENYKRLSELVDKIADPSKKIDDHHSQWSDRNYYLAGNHHTFREVFRGTKTVDVNIIRILENSNHARFMTVDTRVNGDKDNTRDFTEAEKAKLIDQALKMYEKENGKKATCIILGTEGRNGGTNFMHKDFKSKKPVIYMPSEHAEDWSFGEYWDFMKEVGTFRGLKVIEAYHVDKGKPFQVLACRMTDLKIDPNRPFPRVANYLLLEKHVNYHGFFNRYY